MRSLLTYSTIIEQQFASIDSTVTQLVDVLTHREPGIGFLHDEATHPSIRGFGIGISFGEDGVGVAVLGVSDEHLAAVQDILFTVSDGSRLYALNITTGFWFRQTQTATNFTSRHARQNAFFLLFGTVFGDYRRHQEVRTDRSANAHPTLAELFEDNGEGYVV